MVAHTKVRAYGIRVEKIGAQLHLHFSLPMILGNPRFSHFGYLCNIVIISKCIHLGHLCNIVIISKCIHLGRCKQQENRPNK